MTSGHSRLCVKGRSIGMLGERRDQTTAGQEWGRAKSAERKKMWIKLAIESNEFHTFAETLRVHGIIEEAHFDIGSHHTHIIEIRDEIELTSQNEFPKVDHDLISQACSNSGKAKVVIIVVESDEAILYEVTGKESVRFPHGRCAVEGNTQGLKLAKVYQIIL